MTAINMNLTPTTAMWSAIPVSAERITEEGDGRELEESTDTRETE